MKRNLQMLLICGMLLIYKCALADGGQLLYPFSAKYKLSLGGMTLGNVSVSLDIDTQGNYQYAAHTVTTGLVAVIRDDEVSEISRGTINHNRVTPQHYSYSHKKPDQHRQVNLTFQWDKQKVINQTPGSLWSMSITPGVQDKFSQQLALILQLNEGEERFEYRVADGGRLKSYTYTNQGSEQITTSAGNFHSIRLTRQKQGRESKATFWMAPELNYLPVKVIRHEGDDQFHMELVSITWKQ